MNSLMSLGLPVVIYVLVLAAVLGLVMGSFINCWAWRYMNGESVLKGRSHCTSCNHPLGVADLVPVFSWLFSGGKCRYCGAKVSARYPLTELICAVVFVAIVSVYGLTLETVELMAFSGILLFLSLTDLDDYLIPNGCIISAIVVRAIYLAASYFMGTMTTDQILFYVASGFGVGIALVIVVLIADRVFGRDSMGGGDLKLYFVAGLYFGWQQCLLLVILSCIIGIVVALVGMRSSKPAEKPTDDEGGNEPATKADADNAESDEGDADADEGVMKRTIPFGPSIAAACVIVMLVGNNIINWYLSFM